MDLIHFVPLRLSIFYEKTGERYIYTEIFNFLEHYLKRIQESHIISSDYFLFTIFKTKEKALNFIYKAVRNLNGGISLGEVMNMKKDNFIEFVETIYSLDEK